MIEIDWNRVEFDLWMSLIGFGSEESASVAVDGAGSVQSFNNGPRWRWRWRPVAWRVNRNDNKNRKNEYNQNEFIEEFKCFGLSNS